eukprot:3927613-Pyramimonas_sp.AAC.1
MRPRMWWVLISSHGDIQRVARGVVAVACARRHELEIQVGGVRDSLVVDAGVILIRRRFALGESFERQVDKQVRKNVDMRHGRRWGDRWSRSDLHQVVVAVGCGHARRVGTPPELFHMRHGQKAEAPRPFLIMLRPW